MRAGGAGGAGAGSDSAEVQREESAAEGGGSGDKHRDADGDARGEAGIADAPGIFAAGVSGNQDGAGGDAGGYLGELVCDGSFHEQQCGGCVYRVFAEEGGGGGVEAVDPYAARGGV